MAENVHPEPIPEDNRRIEGTQRSEGMRRGEGVGSYKPRDLTVPRTGPQGPFQPDEYSMVGIFDIGALAPRAVSGAAVDYSESLGRVLDNMAASPGAFTKVRMFKCLNSGAGVETTTPTSSGTVWAVGSAQPDFAVTLAGLAAIVQRKLIPFISLGFFPAHVSGSPITPPPSYTDWMTLVQAFLNALTHALGTDVRFKNAPALDKWWFEVWNEPNMPEFWKGQLQDYLDLYQATSDAVVQWQSTSGVTVQLGGPAIVWDVPSDDLGYDGPGWMQAFLTFVGEPQAEVRLCIAAPEGILERSPRNAAADVDSVVNAADQTATMARALGLQDLSIVNDESDMKRDSIVRICRVRNRTSLRG